jgi:DNA-binding PucR family transcriptional regulator
MKTTVSAIDFVDAFRRAERNDFSPTALRALFEHIEEMESDTGEEYELDVVALCCEWQEFKTALEAAVEYGFDAGESAKSFGHESDSDETEALDWLREQTQVVEFDGGVLVMGF